MLVLYRDEQRWEDRKFVDFPGFLRPGDCLVLNNSKVIPSRLFGHRAGHPDGLVEVFLLHPLTADRRDWKALVRPGRKVRIGDVVEFDGLKAEILDRGEIPAPEGTPQLQKVNLIKYELTA